MIGDDVVREDSLKDMDLYQLRQFKSQLEILFPKLVEEVERLEKRVDELEQKLQGEAQKTSNTREV